MDDRTSAPPPARRTTRRHLPHDVVTDILLQLPVVSLLRFRHVSKAWRATISNDLSFGRGHHRLHHHSKSGPYLLIAPQTKAINIDKYGHSWEVGRVATSGLYRWEESHNTVTLLHPMGTLPAEVAHDFVHCDGLVLAATESAVRVINPATCRVLVLPLSLNAIAPCRSHSRSLSCQAFGLGHEPRSDTYKVARFFHRKEPDPRTMAGYRYVPRVEVFNIGTDQNYWRETTMHPPCHVMPQWTATFYNGSLIWTIDQQRDREAAPGFLRFLLHDETFHVVPPPLSSRWFDQDTSTLSMFCGRLFLTCVANSHPSLNMWMCSDIVDGQWEKHYTIDWNWIHSSLHPVAMGNGILMCRVSGDSLCRCILKSEQSIEVKGIFSMTNLEYYNPIDATVIQYPWETKSYLDVIPYVPSLVPV